MNVIGSMYNSDVVEINSPGTQWYVEPVNDSMSCDQLQSNLDSINSMVQEWNRRVVEAVRQFIPSRTTINNCKIILAILHERQANYTTALAACLARAAEPPPAGAPGSGGSSSSGVMWLFFIAGGVLLYKKFHSNKRARS